MDSSSILVGEKKLFFLFCTFCRVRMVRPNVVVRTGSFYFQVPAHYTICNAVKHQ